MGLRHYLPCLHSEFAFLFSKTAVLHLPLFPLSLLHQLLIRQQSPHSLTTQAPNIPVFVQILMIPPTVTVKLWMIHPQCVKDRLLLQALNSFFLNHCLKLFIWKFQTLKIRCKNKNGTENTHIPFYPDSSIANILSYLLYHMHWWTHVIFFWTIWRQSYMHHDFYA